ncbi:uncharacterized protein LOC114563968 isoform X1 [Perca flavescens]|uniref:uncharacterized protein LOC114563968 isoform X1 n=1 Tax=Perca flavescens TaxID=8167 RepID=UPI00106E4CDE|nr:uncharacterized protein LOC114563968 isoform X1 [Perca flavescens]
MEEILQEYPRFLDIPTLLDTEFGKMHQGKGDLFLRRWEASIMPKLKAVAAREKGDVASLVEGMEDQTDGIFVTFNFFNFSTKLFNMLMFTSLLPQPHPPRFLFADEKCYIMLVVLTHLLPPVAASRCSVKSAITQLVDFVPAGSTIASLYNTSQDPAQSTQPQLVCIGHLRGGSQQYVIVGKSDKIAIPLDEGLACAVDKLFKLYWVCNLAYPAPLSSVFSFVEYIYDLPMSTNRRAKVLELISKVKSIN